MTKDEQAEALAAERDISVPEAHEILEVKGYAPEDARGPGLTPPKGHNDAAKEKLRQVVQGIVSLKEEVKEAQERVKDAMGEAKALGYDKPTIAWAIKELSLDPKDREMRDALRDTYMDALEDLAFYD